MGLLALILLAPFAFASSLSERADRVAALGSLFPVDDTVSVKFVKLGGDPWQLGILQTMRVNAPVEKLTAALDDVGAYVGLFDDMVKAEKRDVKGLDDYSVFTETSIPLPFIPNDKTTLHYRISHLPAGTLYRYSLVEGNHLRAYEGVALAASAGPRSSVYWELDLLEPAFGISRSLPAKKFWVQNAQGNAQSDWALKLRAEDPARKAADVLDDSKKRAEALSPDYDAAIDFDTLLAQATPAKPSASETPKKPAGPPPSTAKPKARGPKSEPKP